MLTQCVLVMLHAVPAAAAVQGKFGGLFASMPGAMVSGLFCVMFGCICAGALNTQQQQAKL
jgi:xanthine/uracil permease